MDVQEWKDRLFVSGEAFAVHPDLLVRLKGGIACAWKDGPMMVVSAYRGPGWGRVGRFSLDLEFFPHVGRKELRAMGNKLLAKASGSVARGKSVKGVLPSAFMKAYPILSAFMTEVLDANDHPREVSKVTVFVDAGRIGASLSDPRNECSLFVTLPAPEALYEVLEAALGRDELDWRPWGGKHGKKSAGKA